MLCHLLVDQSSKLPDTDSFKIQFRPPKYNKDQWYPADNNKRTESSVGIFVAKMVDSLDKSLKLKRIQKVIPFVKFVALETDDTSNVRPANGFVAFNASILW